MPDNMSSRQRIVVSFAKNAEGELVRRVEKSYPSFDDPLVFVLVERTETAIHYGRTRREYVNRKVELQAQIDEINAKIAELDAANAA